MYNAGGIYIWFSGRLFESKAKKVRKMSAEKYITSKQSLGKWTVTRVAKKISFMRPTHSVRLGREGQGLTSCKSFIDPIHQQWCCAVWRFFNWVSQLSRPIWEDRGHLGQFGRLTFLLMSLSPRHHTADDWQPSLCPNNYHCCLLI